MNEAIFKDEYLPSVEAKSLDAWTAYAGDDVKNNPKVDLYVTFGKDPNYYGTVGLAWVGTACKSDGYGTSFNEHRNTPAATAGVIISSIFLYYIEKEKKYQLSINSFESFNIASLFK